MSTISVVIPIYFKEKTETILNCFRSMSNQTVLPDEIVLVLDNPSTEEIENTIDRFASETSIKIIKCYCDRGSGFGALAKVGVEHCSSDYIARMDIDDVAVFTRLEKERDFLDKNLNVDVVGSNIAEFENNINEIIAYRIVPSDDKCCKKMLKRRDPINHMTAMYRRESVLKAGNYSLEMKCFEDSHLWVSFYVHNMVFANLQEVLVYVHAGKEMYERRGGKKNYLYIKRIIQFKRKARLINWLESSFQKMVYYLVLVLMTKRMRAFVYERVLRHKRIKRCSQ